MATLGMHYQPDQMLIGADGLAMRAPRVGRARAGLPPDHRSRCTSSTRASRRSSGAARGCSAALVLATMPDWYFLAHQTMTDMPFVAPMAAAMGLLMLGLATDERRSARASTRSTRFGQKWQLSALAPRLRRDPRSARSRRSSTCSRATSSSSLHGEGTNGFRLHWDEFRSGSAAATAACPATRRATRRTRRSIPKAAGVHPESVRRERSCASSARSSRSSRRSSGRGARRRCSTSTGASAACGASTTSRRGSSPRSRRWARAPRASVCRCSCGVRRTSRPTKRWTRAHALRARRAACSSSWCVALPWYVAMYVRHGPPFTDRLIFHDMFNRAFHHVHDTNEGDDTSFRFYVWQLGYATLPVDGPRAARASLVAAQGRHARATRRTLATNDVSVHARACGSSSPSPSSRSWGRSSTTTSSRPCRRSRCSSASSSTTCSAGPTRRARASPILGVALGAALMAAVVVARVEVRREHLGRPRQGLHQGRQDPARARLRPRPGRGARRAARVDEPALVTLPETVAPKATPRTRSSDHRALPRRSEETRRGAGGGARAHQDARAPHVERGGRRGRARGAARRARSRRPNRRARTSPAPSACSSSSRTTTGARGPSRSTSTASSRRFAIVVAVGARARCAIERIRQCAVARDLRVRVRVGACGASTSTWSHCAALGPARGHRGVLPRRAAAPTSRSSPTR